MALIITPYFLYRGNFTRENRVNQHYQYKSKLTILAITFFLQNAILFKRIKMEDLHEEICSHLWCVKPTNPDSCVTRGHLTAVYGTKCGEDKVT